MAWYRAGGAGIPAALKTGMNDVLNKKFGTSTTYAPNTWPDTVNLMGPLPEKTVSGSIANITDGADTVPVKSWQVTLPASLDGYSEVNGVRTGKNLWNVTAITNTTNPNNATIVNNGNGTITVTTTTQQNVKTAQKLKNICPNVKVGETYFLNATTTGNQKIIYLHQAAVSWTYGTAKVITSQMLESDVSLYASGTNSTATISDLSLTYGNTATAYEVYTAPTQYTADLGRTIYGGQADVVNGQGESIHANVKVSDLTWTKQTASGRDFFISQVSNMKTGTPKEIASVLPYGGEITVAAMADKSLASWTNSLRIYDTDITTVSELLEAYGNDGISYPLATPETFTFTPITPTPETALGVNNFWADEGDSQVTYRRDIDLALGGG